MREAAVIFLVLSVVVIIIGLIDSTRVYLPTKPKARTRRSRIRPRVYARQPRPANPSTDLRLQGVAAALGTSPAITGNATSRQWW
jgi:hypothetical protein